MSAGIGLGTNTTIDTFSSWASLASTGEWAASSDRLKVAIVEVPAVAPTAMCSDRALPLNSPCCCPGLPCLLKAQLSCITLTLATFSLRHLVALPHDLPPYPLFAASPPTLPHTPLPKNPTDALIKLAPTLTAGLVLWVCMTRAESPWALPVTLAAVPAAFHAYLLISGTTLAQAQDAGWVLKPEVRLCMFGAGVCVYVLAYSAAKFRYSTAYECSTV